MQYENIKVNQIQIRKDLEGHGKESGLYSKNLLKSFKQGSDVILKSFKITKLWCGEWIIEMEE